MKLTGGVIVTGIVTWALVAGCQTKDSEVRTYIENDLRPYLDSLAYQVCQIKYSLGNASTIPGRIICPGGPDGYKPPPPDGHP